MKKTYTTPEMINVLVDVADILTVSKGGTGLADILDFESDFTQK